MHYVYSNNLPHPLNLSNPPIQDIKVSQKYNTNNTSKGLLLSL